MTDWDAAAYDRLADPQDRWGRAVLSRLELQGSETVLDAGCGSGRVTEALLDRLPRGRVVAVDASSSMLSEARSRLSERLGQVRFVQTDLLDLEPATVGDDMPVDAVLSTATFHWITDHERLFFKLSSVMRPGAQLVAQCGAEGNIKRLLEAVRSLGVERPGTWLYPSVADTEVRLRSAGFTELRVWTNAEPTAFADRAVFADFLEAICLRAHVATLPPAVRRDFVERVAAEMAEPVIDYVRLNILARKGEHYESDWTISSGRDR